jgi:hypothetical protein
MACGPKERQLPDKRKRRVIIRIKRNKRAKKKIADGYKKVIERASGRRNIRFVKPAAN